jgi:hypothetical protein
MILGLDLGRKTGWAVAGEALGSRIICAGTWTLATPKEVAAMGLNKDNRNRDIRVPRLQGFLEATLKRFSPVRAIFFEDVQFKVRGLQQIQLWSSLRAVVWLTQGVRCVAVPVGTLKKFATGFGNASKGQMEAALCLKASKDWDDNAIDAVHLVLYGQQFLSKL